MAIDERAFREALGRFATGVCVVGAPCRESGAIGVTITSFASLSLAPPLILFCIGRQSANYEALMAAPAFSVNILGAEQTALSERFASQLEDKFAGVPHTLGRHNVPLISGCLASLECVRVAVHPGGDHDIVVGRVDGMRIGAGSPLLRYCGSYCQLGDPVDRPRLAAAPLP